MERVGTVIHGTFRTQDLHSAFCREIERVWRHVSHIDGLTEEMDDIEFRGNIPADHPYWDDDDILYDIERMRDILNEAAPQGMYFGPHEGDGSDFGYWGAGD
jgi:hypothetical protein